MPEFYPILLGLVLILVIGVTIPIILSDVVEPSEIVVNNSLLNFTINKINSSITIPSPLLVFDSINETLGESFGNEDILGEEGETALINYLKLFSLIPNWILTPILIIIIVCFAYSLIILIAYLYDSFVPF